MKCQICNGTGKDGFDRCYPPNPYICRFCDGSGEVTPEEDKALDYLYSEIHNTESECTKLRKENRDLQAVKNIIDQGDLSKFIKALQMLQELIQKARI